MINLMVQVFIKLLKMKFMMANGLMEKSAVMESKFGQIKQLTLVNGLIIYKMAQVFLRWLMVIATKENLTMDVLMEKVFSRDKTVKNILESGRMIK